MTEPWLHSNDGALVRLLDGEPLDNAEAAHLPVCAECLSRLDVLAAHTARFSQAVHNGPGVELMPPADLWNRVLQSSARRPGSTVNTLVRTKPLRHDHYMLKAAAVAGILLAGALAAEPVRDWFADLITRMVQDTLPNRETPRASEGSDAPVMVGFVPAGDRLEIRLDNSQSVGTIRVIFEVRGDATGEIMAEGSNASLLLLPDGFLVRNDSARDLSYVFRVPLSISTVRVVIGGEILRTLTPEDGSVEMPARVSR